MIERSRTLRQTTRKPTSQYKVDVRKVERPDLLRLTLRSERGVRDTLVVFEFAGFDLADRDSIHFDASLEEGTWRIVFGAVQPMAYCVPA